MEIPQYQTQWHGIDLLQFPAAKDAQNKPAGPEFYDQFYGELAKRPVSPAFIAGKAAFGPVCYRQFIKPWEDKHGRKPKILSLGVGKGYIEEAWLKAGYEVTLNECQEHSIRELLEKYPNARPAVGDAARMDFEKKFDIIAIISLDSSLRRSDLLNLFTRAHSWLAPGGVVIFQSAGVLSVRQALKETIKFVKRKLFPKPHVFWGWWRPVSELCKLGEAAGFRISGVFDFRTGADALCQRSAFFHRFPTMKSSLVAILFERN